MAAINHPLGGARRLPIPAPRIPGSINWWVLGGVLIVGVSAMLPVLQSSLATSEGFKTQGSEAQEQQLRGQISELEANVAELTSLDRIQRRATELGLGPASNPIYVRVDEPGPAPAKIPAQYLPTGTPPAAQPESWWESLIDSVMP
jgi:hypothetical protein